MNETDHKGELPAELMAYFGSGPWFDLSVELGPTGNTALQSAALSRLWTCCRVSGPWVGPTKLPQTPFGILKMVDDGAPRLPFAACSIREQDASDWLTLGIPVRALQAHWPVDGSWCLATQPWLATLCSALSEVADHLYAQIPFAVGVMGEEASGCWRCPTSARAGEAHQGYPPLAVLSAEVIEERGGFVVPPDLWANLKPSSTSVVLPSGLLYSPPQHNATLNGA